MGYLTTIEYRGGDLRIGALRHKVLIQSPIHTKSLSGSMVTTWEDWASLWAGIENFRAYAKQAANAAWPGADSKITIHYVKGLLPTMRIVYEDKIYSILGINDLEERHREMELTCQSGIKNS